MIRTLATAAALLAFTAPAFAEINIGDYPRTAGEVEYCVKARMNKSIALPEGCKTLGERLLTKLTDAMD